MTRDHARSEKGTWQSGDHQHCSRKLMTRDHAQTEKGTWQSGDHQHCGRKLMTRDHARPEKGTWQSGDHQHCSRKLMTRDHARPEKGTWQNRCHRCCSKFMQWDHVQAKYRVQLVAIGLVRCMSPYESTHLLVISHITYNTSLSTNDNA